MSGRERRERRRWPYFGPPQRAILFAGFAMLFGAVLPWAVLAGRLRWAEPLALMWGFWAATVTLAAGMVPWRAAAIVSAALGGGTAVFFAGWQTLRIFAVCGLTLDCVPGPGLGLLLAAGAAALYEMFQLARARGARGR